MAGWTVEVLDGTLTIAETVFLGTASAIVIVPTARTIIGGNGTLCIGEIQTSIRDTGLTDAHTKTRTIF
jgi:hypothetical protein